ncbi:MAG: 2-aminobenzoate-CoA ligase [Candidatus Meridianibacter frigidus]|nr:MAG: 2-aminobenzoate-CoA ligase [Candidatus Eremiobacteraeota bacterium]
MYTAHVDLFARSHLPPRDQWPDLIFDFPELHYPEKMNCATRLLDRHIAEEDGNRRAIVWPGGEWTYEQLQTKANQIAAVLVDDLGIVPGNRVLLRGFNGPMLAACWFAVMKAGAIAITAMPLYRETELKHIVEKASVHHALCDLRLADALDAGVSGLAGFTTKYFGDESADGLEAAMESKPSAFKNVESAAEDVALIAFTSGTTGKAKATMHFHRDVLAVCDTFAKSCLRATPEDLFCGSPPLGFTFGLGGLLLFPMDAGAATLLLEKATPELLMQTSAEQGVSVVFTAPVAFRTMAGMADRFDLSRLRTCVSAGETLPLPVYDAFLAATGVKIIDGIGGTEMLHIYISAREDEIRPGSTGKAVPGYQARVVDDNGKEVRPGMIGRLAVRGPTGCRYLNDERQLQYVQNGWNFPGDAYRMDEDGYFWYVARLDDMIVAAGYNISGPEVEEALLAHPDVKECAVVAKPDPARHTNMVKAFVVLNHGCNDDLDEVLALQDFVKTKLATFKCPREIEFVRELPRTETGKLQRFVLRNKEVEKPQ